MRSISLPGSLAIVKLDERHYQVNDTSAPSIGICLGVFPTQGAAESFADKLTKIRERATVNRSVRQSLFSGRVSERVFDRQIPNSLQSIN